MQEQTWWKIGHCAQVVCWYYVWLRGAGVGGVGGEVSGK